MRSNRKKPWKRGFFLFRFRNPVEARSDRHAECDFFVKCEKALAFTGLRGYIKAGKRKNNRSGRLSQGGGRRRNELESGNRGSPGKEKNMKKLTLLLMTLAAVLVFAGCGKPLSPKDTALSWARAIIGGDLAKANKYSTPESKEINEMLIEKGRKYDDERRKKELDRYAKRVEASKEVIDGDTATLVVRDETIDDGLPLKKIDGKWKVDATKI